MAALVAFVPSAYMVAGCANNDDIKDESVGSAAQAISLPQFGPSCDSKGKCTVEILVPQGIPETQFAASAAKFVHLNDRAKAQSVDGRTPVLFSGGGWARAGVDTTFGHFLSPSNPLQVGNSNNKSRRMYGDIYSGRVVGPNDYPTLRTFAEWGTPLSGKLIEGPTDPRMPDLELNTIWSFDWPTIDAPPGSVPEANTVFTPTTLAFLPSSNASQSYGDVIIRNSVTVTLRSPDPNTPGTFFFKSLTLDSGGTLILDTSNKQPVRLAIAGNIVLNAPVKEIRAAEVAAPARGLIAYVGPNASVNATKSISGVLVAPGADVSTWGYAGAPAFAGAIFGNSVEVHQDGLVSQSIDPSVLKNPATAPKVRGPDDLNRRYVSHLGFLDGGTCDHWPLDLHPAGANGYVSLLADKADDASKTLSAKILAQLVRSGGTDPVITAFGSPDELLVTSFTEYSEETRGLERRLVAVDPVRKTGFAISHARICRESDIKTDTSGVPDVCEVRSIPLVVNGKVEAIDVLWRSTPDERFYKTGADIDKTEESKTVQLIAPTVRFEPLWDNPHLYGSPYAPKRVQFDTNVIIAADNVVRGTGNETEPIELEVRPYAAVRRDRIAQDLVAPTRPGLLAVLASKTVGISRLATLNGARVETTTCYTAPGYTAKSGADDTPLASVWRVAEAVSPTYRTRTRAELHISTRAAPTPFKMRQAEERGGLVVFTGASSVAQPELLAPSMKPNDTAMCSGAVTSPSTPKAAETYRDTSEKVSLTTGQILSKGLFFASLVNHADRLSVAAASGLPSADYVRARAVLDLVAPGGNVETGVDAAIQGRVRGLAAASEHPEDSISLNALGSSYGDVARPWLPNNAESTTARSVNELLKHWDDVKTTADKLQQAITDGENNDVIVALLDNISKLASSLNTYAADQRDAAQSDKLTQAAAIDSLKAARDGLQANQYKFLNDMCELTKPKLGPGVCTWERLDASVKNMVNGVIGACKAKNKSGGWLDAINAVGAICPYVAAAATAFKGLNTFLEASSNGATYFGLLQPKGPEAFADTLQSMQDNKAWIGFAGDAAEGFSKAKDKVVSGAGALDLLDSDCKDAGDMGEAVTALMGMRTTLALVNSMATQAQTLRAVLLSTASTLQYQTSNESAADALANSALQAMTDIEKWQPSARGAALAGYIAESCVVARNSIRAGEAELIDVTQRLQTSAGWAKTTALPTVPRAPNGASTDFQLGLITSVWDGSSIAKWFDTASGSDSLADRAAQRFVVLNDLACNDGSSQSDEKPSMLMYVRKRIVGAELEYFKKYGHSKVTVGLDDLVQSGYDFANVGYRLSGESWLPLSPAAPAWQPTTAPYVVGVTYSGCFGTPPNDACCQSAGCRGKVLTYEPWVARLGTAMIPSNSGCIDANEWSVGTVPLILKDKVDPMLLDSRTCMHRVQTDAKATAMDQSDVDSVGTPSVILKPVRDKFCGTGTAKDVAFTGVRGEPLFGDWAIGYTEDVAHGMVHQGVLDVTDPTSEPTTEAQWRANNAALTGIELFIVVGLEPLPMSVPEKYETSPYVNADWRWWEVARPQ